MATAHIGDNFIPSTSVTTAFFDTGILHTDIEKRQLQLDGVDTNRYMLVRKTSESYPEERVIRRVVGADYTTISNWEIAQTLNPLSDIYPIDRVGDLADGQVTFTTFKLPDYRINGLDSEQHRLYLMFGDDRRSPTSCPWGFTSVRVSCANMFTTAVRNINLRLDHRSDLIDKMRYQVQLETSIASQLQLETDKFISAYSNLTQTSLTQIAIYNTIGNLFKLPTKPSLVRSLDDGELDIPSEEGVRLVASAKQKQKQWLRRLDLIQLKRQDVADRLEIFNSSPDTDPSLYNTAYGLFQAVTEHVNHAPSRQNHNNKQTSLLFGSKRNTMAKAFSILSKLK